MTEFRRLCAQIGVRPQRVSLPQSFHQIYSQVLHEAAVARLRAQAEALGKCGALTPEEDRTETDDETSSVDTVYPPLRLDTPPWVSVLQNLERQGDERDEEHDDEEEEDHYDILEYGAVVPVVTPGIRALMADSDDVPTESLLTSIINDATMPENEVISAYHLLSYFYPPAPSPDRPYSPLLPPPLAPLDHRERDRSPLAGRTGPPPTPPPSPPSSPSPQGTSFLDKLRESAPEPGEDVQPPANYSPHPPPTPSSPFLLPSPFLRRLQELNSPSHHSAASASSSSSPTPPTHSGHTSRRDFAQRLADTVAPIMQNRPHADSALAQASAAYAKRQAQALSHGDGDMALRTDGEQLTALLDTLDAVSARGISAGTSKVDQRAWLLWEKMCESLGTSPLRTEQDVREHPQKNALLMATLMLYAYSHCRPKDRTKQWIKPSSAMAYPIAIKRIFRRWGIDMPGHRATIAQLHGLKRKYLAHYGPHSLAPRRAEPMKFSMVRDMNNISTGARVNGRDWNDAHRLVFMFRRLNLVMIRTGFRLGEIVKHPSGEIMFLTFACLQWRVNGTLYTDPSPELLHSMESERDCALLAPPRAKPDQFGEIHCPFPATLTLTDEPDNAAAALRDIELLCDVHGDSRNHTALFCNANGEPFTHAAFDKILQDALTHLYGRNVASLYSFHSYRSGLATALHAAGVPDAMIMLICRWMCQDSLHVYRRMGTGENERHVRAAAQATVDVIQTVNVPEVSGDHRYALLFEQMSISDDTQPPTSEATSSDAAARPTVTDQPAASSAQHRLQPPPRGTQIEVYWTDMQTWYAGTVTSHRRDSDGTTVVSRVQYEPTGPWQRPRDLSYWHDLLHTEWRLAANRPHQAAAPASPAPSPPASECADAFDTPPPSPPRWECATCGDNSREYAVTCARCAAGYCSETCAITDHQNGHPTRCPLPMFTSEDDNAVFIDGGRRYLARCVGGYHPPGTHSAGRVPVWFKVPHTSPCKLCSRGPPSLGLHYTWTRVLATQVDHATWADRELALIPRATGGQTYLRFPTDETDWPTSDPCSLV